MKFFFRMLFMIAIMTTVAAPAQQSKTVDARIEARQLLKTIQVNHYQPVPVDDALAEIVFNNVLDDLDPDQIFFCQQDIDFLTQHKKTLDDDLNGKTWTFLPLLTSRFRKSLERALVNVQEATQTPVSISSREEIEEDTTWAVDLAALKERWRLEMKMQVFDALIDLRETAAKMSDADFVKAHEQESRDRVRKNQLRKINRKLQPTLGFDNYVANVFLRAFAEAFDAHTVYVSSREIENYLQGLTTEGYYFGFTLNEDDNGNVTIEELIPGSPAWKSGDVFIGDMLLRMKWEGQEWTDVGGIGMEEVNEMLSDASQTAMYFVLKNKAGIQHTVRLRKEKIAAEENAVKSFVLNGTKKIGYISLPGFYSNWGDEDNARCANDVAKEIIRLKQEGIEGLILDVRNNGGGSMQEAVAMAGIFIDGGPVGILKSKTGEMLTVKDVNRGTVYDGPLVLMVNSMSASASEFLAAALQDYRRAIIVGSRTFGKATAQIIYPIDPGVPQASFGKSSAVGTSFAFVTIEKIYRINGKTVQKKGITPDILLPDYYDGLDITEEHHPRALVSDSVNKKTYYQPLLLLPLTELRHKSEGRQQANPGFKAIRDYNTWLLEMLNGDKPETLYWPDVVKQSGATAKRFGTIEQQLTTARASFTAASYGSELRRMEMDEYIRDFNASRIKKLEKDISLDEAFHIICDYITINTKK